MSVRSVRLLVSVVCLMTVTAFCVGGSAYAQGKKYALLIGLNQYQRSDMGIDQLKYAIADAEALAEVLETQGYEEPIVLTGNHAQRSDILMELNKFTHHSLKF